MATKKKLAKLKRQNEPTVQTKVQMGLKRGNTNISYVGPTPLVSRSFLGKTEGFQSKDEQRSEQRHLKAYKRGDNKFIDGYSGTGRMREPIFKPVLQQIKIINQQTS